MVWAAVMPLLGCGSGATTSNLEADTTPADTAPTDTASTDTAPDVDSAAGADAAASDPLAWPPGVSGPHVCGHRIVTLKYTMPAGLGEREIPVNIWYPATEAKGEHPIYSSMFTDERAYDDAPLAAPAHKGGYPVVVNSHGWQGYAGNSAFLWCHIATHGWVSLVPDHVGNLLLDSPPVLPLVAYLQRPLDVKAILDWAEKPPASDPLAGKLDVAHSAVTGHSFGGFTVWTIAGMLLDQASMQARCNKPTPEWSDCGTAGLIEAFTSALADTRPLTYIAMAGDGGNGGLTAAGGRNAIQKKPVLQMNGTYDDGGQAALFADVTAVDLTWVNVTDGCHQLYGLGNAYLGPPGCANLPDEEGFAIVRPIVLSWLRYHVLGDRSAEVTGIVDGTKMPSPRAVWKHKAPKL